MTLDGWSLNKKIDLLREQVERDMQELRMNFAMLYEYMQQKEEESKAGAKKKKTKKD